jgi:hypothetical protein
MGFEANRLGRLPSGVTDPHHVRPGGIRHGPHVWRHGRLLAGTGAAKRRLRREISVKALAAARAATAPSKAMRWFGTVDEFRLTVTPLAGPVGWAETSVEAGLSFPAALTAVTMK